MIKLLAYLLATYIQKATIEIICIGTHLKDLALD